MTNNPEHRKLSSQFGDITDQTPSSESGGGWDYDPASLEALREDYAKTDPGYAATRSVRGGKRGGGRTPVVASENIVPPSGTEPRGGRSSDMAAQVDLAETAQSLLKSGEISAGEGSASSAFSQSDEGVTTRGRTYKGAGMGGWDMESGPTSSPFSTMRPRSKEEAQARHVGLMYLRIAGPTCNHPTCKAYRAKGMELLGAPVESRRGSIKTGEAPPPSEDRPVIPSKRINKKVAPVVVRPESRGKEKLVGSYGTGKTDDFGDFMPLKGKEHEVTAIDYEPAAGRTDPTWAKLSRINRTLVDRGEQTLFQPEDYLEHHHGPDEGNYKLPWE